MGILDKLMSKDMGLTQSEREDLSATASKLKEELNAKYNAQTAKVKAKDGVDGKNGKDGKDGRDGRDGRNGRDGTNGLRGPQGELGRHGIDGADGVSVTDAHIDFDGSLIIDLSTGRSINVGEVVSQDLEERIKIVTSGGAGSGGGGSGTVTSVAATAGTGISITGSPITTSGTLNITNTAPDQVVALTSGTGISATGTYPNFTIANTAPNQTVALTQGGTTTITGTYPNFTISSADQYQGTVTSVTGTSPVVSSGGTTPAISLASGYGDTLNPYASKTANFVLAAPNGSAGVPTFRAVVASDIPTLNQSTTGNAATVTTNANLTGAVTSIGNATSLGSFTSAELVGALTDETGTGAAVFATSPTLVTPALGTPASGVVTNLTGTASININGTVGATTASTGAFTTLSASSTLAVTGVTTVQAGTAALPAITTTGDTNTGIFFPAADTIAFAEGGAEAVRIDSSGNVGIGTATASNRLTVAEAGGATQRFVDTTSTVFSLIQNGSNGDFTISADHNNLGASTNIIFKSDGATERARIDSSGRLMVGTTATEPSDTNVYGAAFGGGLLSSFSRNGLVAVFNRIGTGEVIRLTSNAVDVGSIDVTASTTSYNTSSDYRLKHDIAPMTGALAKVALLKPCTYKWNVDGTDGQGFIAHELQEVVEGCVTGEKDAVEEKQYEVTPAVKDEKGRVITAAVMGTRIGPVYQGIDTSFLVATLTAAIQEQQALITALTTRITALETP